MDLQEQLMYGHRAAEILENPVWKDVWQNTEQLILEATLAEKEDRVALKGLDRLRTMRILKSQLEQSLATGKMAEIQLREKSKMEQAKDWIATTFGT